MVYYTGSMSKKTPEASAKGKGKKEDELAPPYTPEKMKLTTQCFVDAELLEKRNTCIFKGEFHTPEGKKVHMVDLPDTSLCAWLKVRFSLRLQDRLT